MKLSTWLLPLLGVVALLFAFVVGVLAAGWGRSWSDGMSLHRPVIGHESRDVLWDDPELLQEADEDLVEPALSPSGDALVYVRGRAGHNTELVVSWREGREWGEPEPLDALNSPDDELGPAFSPDGQSLYFYSDRPGGLGRYDIWVATLGSNGWSEAVNLGTNVNSVYNEYDPAVRPDGERLFFASDRPVGPIPPGLVPWEGSQRARLGGQFDLFSTRIENDRYTRTGRLEILNTPDDEGQPTFSERGDFLFFSSNRKGGEGGFDLYRSRIIKGRIHDPVNLGSPVNSAADEMDPESSFEGLRLVFSSNAGQEDSLDFSLYQTTTREVFQEWDIGLAGLFSWLRANWLWLLLLLLSLLLLLALLWLLGSKDRRAAIPLLLSCFLVSVIIHLVALLMFTFWILTESILDEIRETTMEVAAVSDETLAREKLSLDLREDVTRLAPTPPSLPALPQLELPNDFEAPPELPAPPELEFAPAQPAKMVVQQPAPRPPDPEVETDLPETEMALPNLSLESAPVELEVAKATSEPEPRTGPAPPAPEEARNETPAPAAPNAVASELPPVQVEAESNLTPEQPTVDLESRPPTLEVAELPPEPPAPEPVDLESNPQLIAEAPVKLPDASGPIEQTPRPPAPVAPSPDAVSSAPLFEAATNRVVQLEPTGAPRSLDSPALPPVEPAALPDIPLPVAGPLLEKPSEPESQPEFEVASQPPVPEEGPRNDGAPALPAGPPATDPDAGNLPAGPVHVAANPSDRPSARPIRSEVPALDAAELPDSSPALAALDLESAPDPRQVVEAPAPTGRPAAPDPAASPAPLPSTPGPVSESTAPRFENVSDRVVKLDPSVSPREIDTPALPPVESAALPDIAPPGSGPVLEQPAQPVAQPETGLAGQPKPEREGDPGRSAAPTPSSGPPVSDPGSESLPTGPINVAANPASEPSARPLRSTAPSQDTADLPGAGPEFAALDLSLEAAPDPRHSVETPVPSGRPSVARPGASPLPLPGSQPASSASTPDAPVAPVQSAFLSAPGLPEANPHALPAEPGFDVEITVPEARPDLGLSLELRPVKGLLYSLRDPDAREGVIEKLGGNKATEEAIQRALRWLADSQAEDGHWDIGSHGGEDRHDMAATGLSVLAYLGFGETHLRDCKYRDTLEKAITWLSGQVKENGDARGGGDMYDQGIASIALCEAYGLTLDPELKPVVESLVSFIVKAQNQRDGGWRYHPNENGDTSVAGWQVMALKSAQLAGVEVPEGSLAEAEKWLVRVGGGKHGGHYGYQNKSPKPAMVAEGMFCRQILDRPTSPEAMDESARYLVKYLPSERTPDFYLWYYGSLALYQHQGEVWDEWNNRIKTALLFKQEREGQRKGSWRPEGQHGARMGRVVSTALSTLTLEVYYRYLPLYGRGPQLD